MQLPNKKWISELWKEGTKNERMSIFFLYVLQYHLFLKHPFRMPHEFFKCFPPWNEPWVYSIKHLISSSLSLSLPLSLSLSLSLQVLMTKGEGGGGERQTDRETQRDRQYDMKSEKGGHACIVDKGWRCHVTEVEWTSKTGFRAVAAKPHVF